MAGNGWGVATRDDDVCVVKVVHANPIDGEADRFEGVTFEDALRAAADAGRLKASCLEKQISFLARSLPDHAGGEPDVARETESTAARAEGRLFPTIATVISALVHETQRERGTSSLYASSEGRLFGPELKQQWRRTDERRAEMMAFRDSNPAGLPRALASRLDRTEEMLGKLVEARNRVEALAVGVPQVIDRYTTVNIELLGIVDELAGRAAMARARFPALAWMALLHAKEKTGVERAQLSSAFAWDHFVDDQHAVISGLIAARHSYLHLFSVAAPQLARELMQRMLKSPVEQAVVDMERVALDHREGGFGVDPAAWFTLISRKIDAFTEVEAAVRVSLAQLGG
jgi:methyl-accepting chemotaxis protein